MKRSLSLPSASGEEDRRRKKRQMEGLARFDDNLLFEVLKHADARTLAMAGCVNKQWHKTAQDERLWELICTEQWANTGCGEQQLRSVVLALGGFRRLHALYLFPLSKPHQTQTSSSASASPWGPTVPQVMRSKPLRLGKDEGWGAYGSKKLGRVELGKGVEEVIGGPTACFFPNAHKKTQDEVSLLCNKCLLLSMFSGSYFCPMGNGHTNEFGLPLPLQKPIFLLSHDICRYANPYYLFSLLDIFYHTD